MFTRGPCKYAYGNRGRRDRRRKKWGRKEREEDEEPRAEGAKRPLLGPYTDPPLLEHSFHKHEEQQSRKREGRVRRNAASGETLLSWPASHASI